jgi:hypothetical protein
LNDLGHVGVSARHSNQFRVSVNTERLTLVKLTNFLIYLGHVGVSARHSNQFRVSVNTERL